MNVDVKNLSDNMQNIVSNLRSYESKKPNDKEHQHIKEIRGEKGEIVIVTNFGVIIDTYLNCIAYIAAVSSDEPIGAGLINDLDGNNRISIIVSEETEKPKHYYTLYALASYIPATVVSNVKGDIYDDNEPVKQREIADDIMSLQPDERLECNLDPCEYIDCSSSFNTIENVHQLLELMNINYGKSEENNDSSAFDW